MEAPLKTIFRLLALNCITQDDMRDESKEQNAACWVPKTSGTYLGYDFSVILQVWSHLCIVGLHGVDNELDREGGCPDIHSRRFVDKVYHEHEEDDDCDLRTECLGYRHQDCLKQGEVVEDALHFRH